MNDNLTFFLVSLVAAPLLLFVAFLALIAGLSFILWEWPHNLDWWLLVRVCCALGWFISIVGSIVVLGEDKGE